MKFHEFGDKGNPIIILIHGVLTPWQMWESQIEHYKSNYRVIVPALNAHMEENTSEYISAENEAKEIAEYIVSNYGNNVFMIAGLSMGGVVAYKILEKQMLNIEHLILDGAPLVQMPKFMESIMRKNYLSIVHGSRNRDKKTLDNFVKYFLPEKFLAPYLAFADTMSDKSIANIVNSACGCKMSNTKNIPTKILFIHGTAVNEMYAKKSAKKLSALHSSVRTVFVN